MRLIFHRGRISIGWGLDEKGEVILASERNRLGGGAFLNIQGTSSTIPEEWLEDINRRLSQEAMPYHQRPVHAILEWTEVNKCSVVFGSELSEKVHAWFYRNSPPEAHHIGPLYAGAFYYDAYFWRVHIPLTYGTVNLSPWVCLKGVPETVRVRLQSDTDAALQFMGLWADCVDYAFGRDDISKVLPDSFGKRLFTSADHQLEATVALLHERTPNAKATESARMATEIFLKAFISLHRALTEQQAKKIGHNLGVALNECLTIQPSSELAALRVRIDQMPPVSSRYEAKQCHREELWFAYGTAQFAGSAVARSLTDRNMRAEVERKLGNAAVRDP